MFEHYYGEHCARLNINQSVYPQEKLHLERSWLLIAFSGLLFWIPDQCMTRLHKIWVDNILYTARWNDFLSDKKKEWEKTITPVILLSYTNPYACLTFVAGHGALIRECRVSGDPEHRLATWRQHSKRGTSRELHLHAHEPGKLHDRPHTLSAALEGRTRS